MVMLKIGDLVQPVNCDWEGIPLFREWRDVGTKFSQFRPEMLGIVLDSYQHMGGNGCKVALPGGKVGWCNLYYLRVVSED